MQSLDYAKIKQDPAFWSYLGTQKAAVSVGRMVTPFALVADAIHSTLYPEKQVPSEANPEFPQIWYGLPPGG
jgi:hypothetical protein